MQHQTLPSSFLAVFRVLIAFRLLLWLYEAFLFPWLNGFDFKSTQLDIGLILVDFMLLMLLFWLETRSTLALRLLPFLIVFSSLPLFLQTYWVLDSYNLTPALERMATGALPLTADVILWQVLIAWQYNMRAVLAFEAFVIFIDWQLLNYFATPGTFAYSLTVEDLVLRVFVDLIIGYIIIRLVQQLRQQQSALQSAYAQQVATNAKLAHYAATVEQLAITQERNRLARELHDTLAHSLSALSVQLEAADSLWQENPTTARHLLSRAKTTARTGLAESRGALQALRAAPLKELGLIEALRELAHNAAERGEFTLELALPDESFTLSVLLEQGIYRIAQEALENVVRHAEAENVQLSLTIKENIIILIIADDGVGFDPDSASNRWGIQGMRERAQMLAGTLSIQSAEEQGTRVYLEVNYDSSVNM